MLSVKASIITLLLPDPWLGLVTEDGRRLRLKYKGTSLSIRIGEASRKGTICSLHALNIDSHAIMIRAEQ